MLKTNRLLLLIALLFAAGIILSACGSSNDEGSGEESGGEASDSGENQEGGGDSDFKVGMVTDVGGVDDKSFNQSAWEGLKAFGEENGLEEGEGFDYAQSESDADFMPNLNSLVKADYDLVFGIGFKLTDALNKVAGQNPDTHFALVDAVAEADNIANITFKEHQGSFLVGVAAAMKTESDKVGFVGGENSELIKKFESGFRAGVASVNPDIEVDVQYAESFGAPDKGKVIASNMYNSGVDVIYHSSGATGNGVFAQAKDIKKNDPSKNVWVIGVDRDQYEEGAIGDDNVTLTSMVKRVDIAVQEVAAQSMNGEFPGGEILEFGLEDEGVSVAKTNEEALTDEMVEEIDNWKQKIIDGEVEVPSTEEDLEAYLDSL
ncbi:BMP family ABC transporter substrate-binding protein [Sediminibacillus dalangtanensis]|uniref:BMP family ABC transporter substrate-binding protein n=1 Tax=Sediminibacillus dalangtanensis TaxID=2729421 RepID=A0ABX7VRC4_9BACI|nr:BMP family protein [Sediminibacillus dalangtanensis]QTM99469.1 BMP family ABC transporter substrate-binding protein [Sediminibacillus dalangtanensis]